jgi:hypothetical protein
MLVNEVVARQSKSKLHNYTLDNKRKPHAVAVYILIILWHVLHSLQFVQVIKGSSPVEIRTAPVVQVAVDLAVSLDDFFDPNNLISRLAFVLKIDLSTIRVVK